MSIQTSQPIVLDSVHGVPLEGIMEMKRTYSEEHSDLVRVLC